MEKGHALNKMMESPKKGPSPSVGPKAPGMSSDRPRASVLLVALLAALVLLTPAARASGGEKLPLVIFTVDVETTVYGDKEVTLPEQFETVCEGGVPCGIKYLSGALAERGYFATFFLDVYEHKFYGEGPLSEIARRLDAEGHDVELHTHPQWAYAPERRLMFEYTLEEQKKIVHDGKEVLESWISKPVVAHRAGAYGADENTLIALVENGIYLDSSLFFRYPTSMLNLLPLKRNSLSKYGPLYEFPVTVFVRRESSPVLPGRLRTFDSTRKYDFNWFRNTSEAIEAIDEAEALGLDFIVLFLHSFSFIEGKGKDGALIADKEAMETFVEVLELLRMRGYRTATFRDLATDMTGLERLLDSPDRLPEVTVKIAFYKYLLRLAGINRYNYMRRGTVFGAVIIALGVTLIVLIRRRSSHV